MNTRTQDPFENFTGTLTAEQAAMALSMAESGDTSFLDLGGAPTTTTATADKGTEQPTGTDKGAADPTATKAGEAATGAKDGTQAPEDNINADNAVVLAKDGKHTIPFAKLEAHRKGEQHWKAQAEAAQAQLADLQRQAQERASAGIAPTRADVLLEQAAEQIKEGADISLFGDFSEQGLATGIDKRIDQKAGRLEKRIEELEKIAKTVTEKQTGDAKSDHLNAIYSAHNDADSIVESAEFKAFVDSHPRAVRDTYWKLFDEKTGGTAQDIVEVFTAYKSSAFFKGEASKPAASVKDAAAAALASAEVQPPTSLSSIPGGRADGRNVDEQIGDLDGPAMLAALEGKGSAYVERFLNTRI